MIRADRPETQERLERLVRYAIVSALVFTLLFSLYGFAPPPMAGRPTEPADVADPGVKADDSRQMRKPKGALGGEYD